MNGFCIISSELFQFNQEIKFSTPQRIFQTTQFPPHIPALIPNAIIYFYKNFIKIKQKKKQKKAVEKICFFSSYLSNVYTIRNKEIF